jgi:hypothetical protein
LYIWGILACSRYARYLAASGDIAEIIAGAKKDASLRIYKKRLCPTIGLLLGQRAGLWNQLSE